MSLGLRACRRRMHFTHALVLKGALKERLPFKKAEVQKEKSGDAMEMFLQLMKSQEAERKEKIPKSRQLRSNHSKEC